MKQSLWAVLVRMPSHVHVQLMRKGAGLSVVRKDVFQGVCVSTSIIIALFPRSSMLSSRNYSTPSFSSDSKFLQAMVVKELKGNAWGTLFYFENRK